MTEILQRPERVADTVARIKRAYLDRPIDLTSAFETIRGFMLEQALSDPRCNPHATISFQEAPWAEKPLLQWADSQGLTIYRSGMSALLLVEERAMICFTSQDDFVVQPDGALKRPAPPAPTPVEPQGFLKKVLARCK